uniref:Uncharacterized protein n=1 Tax=Timema genevievae TaxID=629358 RepID=A0A7R9PLI2_TIMGE|nr:unnamed protein product [Timema genevievae]
MPGGMLWTDTPLIYSSTGSGDRSVGRVGLPSRVASFAGVTFAGNWASPNCDVAVVDTKTKRTNKKEKEKEGGPIRRMHTYDAKKLLNSPLIGTPPRDVIDCMRGSHNGR